MPQTAVTPKLVTVAQAATLLAVSEKTVRRWIDAERIPYLKLPTGGYRIPQGALLASLGGNYKLGDDFDQIDSRRVDERRTWNSAQAIAEHRAMTPEQRLRKAISLSQAALRLSRAERVDAR